ncbi:hypothetical protein LSCM1_03565 [Leishmania martiniquensis]|uniref:MSP domain-containing protein n=1 Tax=Leishmania martiniquensis TaxID=1580590 RepID=A0A836KLY2_9TRYP|nr:hypothetical protein LSCM1_03565 [Leishmania martiniquensis]
MATDTLQVKLSQDSLFFPLPFTNATIDNVVQMKNTLPVVQGDPKANVISFKILSRVQYRYSVRPPVGFIGAGEHVTVVFSFNPEHVRMRKNPEERELPTEATRDAIHVDFAVVDAQLAPTALAHWAPGSREAKVSREVMADASQFWKQIGQVKKNSPTMMRYKLKCIFAARNNVPDTLVMCMKEEDDKAQAAADGAGPLPKTRPPMTSSTQPHGTTPPEGPPPRHSESQRTTPTASTPLNDAGYTARTTGSPGISPASPSAASAASVPSSSSPSWAPAQRWGAASDSTNGTVTLHEIGVQVMNYKLSYQVAGALLFATLLCGLFDQSNLLTWLIA